MSPKLRFDLIFYGSAALLGGIIYYCTTVYSEAYFEGISDHRAVVVGTTTSCTTPIKTTGYYLNYEYYYKGRKYIGDIYFKRKPFDDICAGARFLVELDSIKPYHSYLLYDSAVSN